MLDWKEVKGINKNLSYEANREHGVDLPEEHEDVLLWLPYTNDSRSVFSGYFYEDKDGIRLVRHYNSEICGIIEGVKWARFNKPEGINKISRENIQQAKMISGYE